MFINDFIVSNNDLRVLPSPCRNGKIKNMIVREFIEKIIVNQAERVDGKQKQAVEIIYNGIGAIPTLIP